MMNPGNAYRIMRGVANVTLAGFALSVAFAPSEYTSYALACTILLLLIERVSNTKHNEMLEQRLDALTHAVTTTSSTVRAHAADHERAMATGEMVLSSICSANCDRLKNSEK